jgi:preprotein translocase subunit SecG
MLEIIGGALLFITSVLIVILVTLQDNSKSGLSSAIGGSSGSSYLGKNGGRTRDAMLSKITNIAAIVFFVLALVANFIALKLS